MLGKLLSQRHGFRCTVLFAIDKEHGFINPNENANIPGLEALDTADLMIIATRFRDLPDDQFRPILDYIKQGKPVIGLRTATHAFNTQSRFGDYDWNQFGLNVLGEKWVNHHGHHGKEGGRGVIEPAHSEHPILNGVDDVFVQSDIYTVKNLDESQAAVLLRGAVTVTLDPASEIIDGPKNDPMMALAWLRAYDTPNGGTGRAFATTAGAAIDFESDDLRRLIVNACYHLLGLDVPTQADCEPVDEYSPSFFGFINENDFFKKRNMRVKDFALGSSANTIPRESK